MAYIVVKLYEIHAKPLCQQLICFPFFHGAVFFPQFSLLSLESLSFSPFVVMLVPFNENEIGDPNGLNVRSCTCFYF